MPGIFSDAKKKVKVADFSYIPNDALAQLIVDAWVDDGFRAAIATRERQIVVRD